jgi:hypothetical protein
VISAQQSSRGDTLLLYPANCNVSTEPGEAQFRERLPTVGRRIWAEYVRQEHRVLLNNVLRQRYGLPPVEFLRTREQKLELSEIVGRVGPASFVSTGEESMKLSLPDGTRRLLEEACQALEKALDDEEDLDG